MIEIEPAGQADVEGLLELRDGLARWLLDQGIEQWHPGEFPAERLAEWIDAGLVHVHRRAGRLLAAVAVLWHGWLWPADGVEAGYVHLLMVDRSLAAQGVGDAVLRWAEGHIAGNGRSRVRLDAARGNGKLQAWYEARGYREVGQRTFAEPGLHPAILREKTL